ncbi:MAG: GAF domain-containing protein [Lachnospiraceae bacterium]|nr:GAF domain-containing protein [Lachnospiraceae bacterium]
MTKMNYDGELQALLEISIALSAEKDYNKLFNMIITKSMEISNCDAGTLYLYENDKLYFKIMKTISKGVDQGSDGSEINLPPVELNPGNICAYCAINRQILNIPDVYASESFDFSGPKKYDSMTGYHTGSMVAIPLVDSEDRIVGVLQLINAMNAAGEIVAFDAKLEQIIYALSSQAAIAISNMRYQQELKDQMWSFAEAMATAIDERTPYNASHTRKVAMYSGLMADYINKLNEEGKEDEFFNAERKDQLVMGAWLHDIGKLVTPLEVMNKATRLDGREKDIEKRLDKIRLEARISMLEGKISKEDYEDMVTKTKETYDLIMKANAVGFLDDETYDSLQKTFEYGFTLDDEYTPFFTEEEKECLSIRKGTLTAKERKIMEDHVVITTKILDKVHFNTYFKNTPIWAGQHHECLNGKGYPNHLTAEDLTLEARILAVADICDALLATDRPYKKPIPKDKAIDIMRDMAKCGNIDAKLVEYMAEILATL